MTPTADRNLRGGASRRRGLRTGRLSLAILTAAAAVPPVAVADVAPPPPYVTAPPTFLVLLGIVYVLLLAGGGLGGLLLKLARRPERSIPRKRLFLVSAAIALGLTGLLMVASDIGYRRSRAERRARSAVRSYLGAIRSTEVAYFAEWNVWVGNQPLTPVADRQGNNELVAWDSGTRFSILGFAPEGKVICSYSLEGSDWSTKGFTARAECDTDGDGQVAIYTVTNADSEVRKSGAPF